MTTLGNAVVEDFGDAFDQFGEAVIKLRGGPGSRQERIAVLPSIAQLWLSHRLPGLREIEADTTISITALDRAPNRL
ncbi:MAG: hypothetical protein GY896_16355 [Gammaproteobacteria bacterium]|nr:hypothetical protein [Gammaproteobacteria bacterium]